MRAALVVLQSLTFFALGGMFTAGGNWRFGLAQCLLGAVNLLVYV